MDRDDFIIAVFLVVCEQYQVVKQEYRLRRGGFAPALTDEEVITHSKTSSGCEWTGKRPCPDH